MTSRWAHRRRPQWPPQPATGAARYALPCPQPASDRPNQPPGGTHRAPPCSAPHAVGPDQPLGPPSAPPSARRYNFTEETAMHKFQYPLPKLVVLGILAGAQFAAGGRAWAGGRSGRAGRSQHRVPVAGSSICSRSAPSHPAAMEHSLPIPCAWCTSPLVPPSPPRCPPRRHLQFKSNVQPNALALQGPTLGLATRSAASARGCCLRSCARRSRASSTSSSVGGRVDGWVGFPLVGGWDSFGGRVGVLVTCAEMTLVAVVQQLRACSTSSLVGGRVGGWRGQHAVPDALPGGGKP